MKTREAYARVAAMNNRAFAAMRRAHGNNNRVAFDVAHDDHMNAMAWRASLKQQQARMRNTALAMREEERKWYAAGLYDDAVIAFAAGHKALDVEKKVWNNMKENLR